MKVQFVAPNCVRYSRGQPTSASPNSMSFTSASVPRRLASCRGIRSRNPVRWLRLIPFVLVTSMGGCTREGGLDDVFDFDFNNGLSIESTGDVVQLPMAYIDTSYQWSSVHINLNDGAIGDSLLSMCGNWYYQVNPSATVEIWFSGESIGDGVYEFESEAGSNDFTIQIKNDLTFGPAFEFGSQVTENSILSQSVVAHGFTNISNGEPHEVTHASIKIEDFNSPGQTLRYVLELRNEDRIRGSFNGTMESFKRIEFDGDCD